MTFKYTERSPNSQVRRTFACDACATEFTIWQKRDEEIPDCPICEVQAAHKIGLPGVLTNKSRAVDYTHRMAEETFGLTNFNDNQRKGDIAFKPEAPLQTAERDKLMREMVEAGAPALNPDQRVLADNFFAAQQSVNTGNPSMDMVMQHAIGTTAQSAAVARNDGVDPVGLLHQDRTPMKLDVISRADTEGNIVPVRKRR